MNILDDIILNIFAPIVIVLVVCVLFIWMPVHLRSEAECLENGYPESNTTVYFDTYCVDPYGASKVVELESL